MKKQLFYALLVGSILAAACYSTGTKHRTSLAVGAACPDTSWALLPFEKADSVNPVLAPGHHVFTCPIRNTPVAWEEKDVFNPAAVVKDGKVYLLYRAQDKIGKPAGTSRLGLAVSEDGFHFSKMPEPVFYPDNDTMKKYEWEGGVEDPRLVQAEDGRYVLTYTTYDGKTARLALATSTDLLHWQKQGLVFTGRYRDHWSKSGAIVARQVGEKIVAQKINGKYWMYFGDTNIFIATSDDLLHWTPVEENGQWKVLFGPRKGYFDSRLVESGPYALLKDKGILFLYNSMNLDSTGRDTSLAKGAYAGGQVWIDPKNPTKVLCRLEKNFIHPEKPYEINGQVNQVCFLEGLVPFRGKWLLYYGTADSKIAVAVHTPAQ